MAQLDRRSKDRFEIPCLRHPSAETTLIHVFVKGFSKGV